MTAPTPEQRARVFKLTAEGKSRAAVAEIVGLTINQVVGLVARYGQNVPGRTTRSNSDHRMGKNRPRKRKQGKYGGSFNHALDAERKPPMVMPVEVPRGPTITFDDLANSTCRWPFGDPRSPDFGFCGSSDGTNNVMRKPYCREHAKVAGRMY